MYALVNDVASYPAFVPHCVGATIHHQDVSTMEATLTLDWKGMGVTVTTKNKLIENQSIKMNLLQGMVRHLTGEWQFIPKGEHTCQVKLVIHMEFKNAWMGLVFKGIGQSLVNRVTDAFCERAKVIYP
jgi:ribosome-associated toxin RatA of RatAB toxin-antitoxin module